MDVDLWIKEAGRHEHSADHWRRQCEQRDEEIERLRLLIKTLSLAIDLYTGTGKENDV